MTTRPPASATASASARPMPRLDPVMIATFPDKSKSFMTPSDHKLRLRSCRIDRYCESRVVVTARSPFDRGTTTRLDLSPQTESSSPLNFAVKTVSIDPSLLYAGRVENLAVGTRSSHEQRRYDEERRSAASDQDNRELCGSSYARTGSAVGPDYLGAANAPRSWKADATAGATHTGGAGQAVGAARLCHLPRMRIQGENAAQTSRH